MLCDESITCHPLSKIECNEGVAVLNRGDSIWCGNANAVID